MEATGPTEADIAALRAFNRVYTQRLGLLNERLDNSPFSLTEARVLYELAHRAWPTAAEISRVLNLDRAQLSRLLKRFTQAGFLTSKVSETHAKHRLLALTESGHAAFAALNCATQAAVGALLNDLSPADRHRLLDATGAASRILDPIQQTPAIYTLRNPRPGDLGLVVHRQAILYAREYGWDWSYEALVAEILSDFVKAFDPAREQAWLAESNDAVVGSIFLMRSADPNTAKLRLLYVEPAARGIGVGRALVEACIHCAQRMGYATLELWTNSVLVSARRIYEAAGFRLRDEIPHHSFGHDLIGQTWSLDLRAAGSTSAGSPGGETA